MFFNKDEWDNSEGCSTILKWREIPQEIIFFLTSIEEIKNSKYNSRLLNFLDYEGTSYRAYAPSHFVNEIWKNRKSFYRPYFISRGYIERKGYRMADFEIHYENENTMVSIFTD